jgi:hypothetical protein
MRHGHASQKTRHVIVTQLCDVTVRTQAARALNSRGPCADTKHFHRIVAWHVCWNALTDGCNREGLSHRFVE